MLPTDKLKPRVPLNTIEATPKAVRKVKEFMARSDADVKGLKVAVKGGGCSGLVYVLDLASAPGDDDKIIEQDGLEIYVPKKAFVFLAGTVLDFTDGLNGKGFEFSNPNAKRTCGCGNSFGV